MTTIAWDGKTVAADSLGKSQGMPIPSDVVKLRHQNNAVYGCCGCVAWFDEWIKWFEHGSDPEKAPRAIGDPDEFSTCIIRFQHDRPAIQVTSDFGYTVSTTGPFAWGSGAPYAVGALLAGATASEAVAIASKLDRGSTGGAILTYNLQTMSWIKDCSKT